MGFVPPSLIPPAALCRGRTEELGYQPLPPEEPHNTLWDYITLFWFYLWYGKKAQPKDERPLQEYNTEPLLEDAPRGGQKNEALITLMLALQDEIIKKEKKQEEDKRIRDRLNKIGVIHRNEDLDRMRTVIQRMRAEGIEESIYYAGSVLQIAEVLGV